MRDLMRHGALSTTGHMLQLMRVAERLERRPRVQFVYLHYVFEDQEAAFRKQIRHLRERYTLASYSEAVNRIRTGQIDRPYLTFSFDDGLKNTFRAATILSEEGVRACFFVCPPMLDDITFSEKAAFVRDRLHMPPLDLLNWEDCEALVNMGHEVGSHTMNHVNLGKVEREQLHAELHRSREILADRLGQGQHFAWPYGTFDHINATAARAVYDAGYDSCASAVRGCHVSLPSDAHGLCIRRDHVVASWPLSHIDAFLLLNTVLDSRQQQGWPLGWDVPPSEAQRDGIHDQCGLEPVDALHEHPQRENRRSSSWRL